MAHGILKSSIAAFVGLSTLASAVPEIGMWNDRAYRASSPTSFDYQGGELVFVLFDGNAFSNVECPFLPAGPGLLPYFPGAIPCPAGHNAFISVRFGDRDNDVANIWGRLGAVTEASRIPARLPELIEFAAGPITDLGPRPSREFVDRSTLVLHDLQTASFEEKDTTQYEMRREYLIVDADANADGVRTPAEMQAYQDAIGAIEQQHLRETIIISGSSNGWLFTYPNRPWIEANKDLDASFAPRDQIAVSQLNIIEAFPGISKRAGITNASSGFFFKNLDNFGTDYDGDPALLMDYRLPGTIAWDGNDVTNLITSLDSPFMKTYEYRFDGNGTPLSYAGDDGVAVIGVRPGIAATDPVVLATTPATTRLDQDPFSLTFGFYALPGHNLESAEEIYVYQTGYSALDGQRFFVNLVSAQAGFDSFNEVELFLDDGLNNPLLMAALPTGTSGFIDPVDPAFANVPDITITADGISTSSVTTLAPHGLIAGDSFTFTDTGLTAFDNQTFFVGGTVTANSFELFTDMAGTTAVITALPNPALLSTIVPVAAGEPYVKDFQQDRIQGAALLSSEGNDFEYPIYPFPFVDQNFGGQLLLPGLFDKGYEFPDVAFRIFFGTSLGAQDLAIIPPAVRPRNDLIFRLRYLRNGLVTSVTGGSALTGGDQSQRDFELEICLVDTLAGATKALQESLLAANKSATKGAKSDSGGDDEDDLFGVYADTDGDGQSNLFEFAFDTNGSMTEELPAFGDASRKVSAQVTAQINPTSGCCELTVGKRPGVREYLEYFFEEVKADGTTAVIDPLAEDSAWTLVEDSNEIYKLVSNSPVVSQTTSAAPTFDRSSGRPVKGSASSGETSNRKSVSSSSFYRACVRKNTFGVEITE